MKNLYCRLIGAILLLSGFTQAAEPVRFIAWNLEWFPGQSPTATPVEAAKHMKAAQEALKKLNPDIFVAEEIRDWAAFHELVSVVPGLTVNVVSSFRDPESGMIRAQQVAIASKLKCQGAWWEAWKANYPNISRGFSFAALEHPDGGLIMVYGVHLKSNRGDPKDVADMRAEQARQILAHRSDLKLAYSEKKILGWVVAGDVNTNDDGQYPQCKVIKILTDGGFYNTWVNTPKEKRLTWASKKESKFEPTTFDYIFTDGFKKNNAILLDPPGEISDHHPVGIALSVP